MLDGGNKRAYESTKTSVNLCRKPAALRKTILVVEDNADAREMLSFILTAEGYSVTTAEDGQQGLDKVWGEPPDLIITDIDMPKLDGIEMIKRLRAESESRAMPIVVMSAFGSGVIKDALDAGASRSSPKPMQVRSLLSLVRQLLA